MHEIQSTDEFNTFVGTEKYLLVDFSAEWCGPCKRLKPQLELLSEAYHNVKFLKVDVDKLPDLTEFHQVEAMPTMMFYVNGTLQSESVKGANIEKVKSLCEKFFV